MSNPAVRLRDVLGPVVAELGSELEDVSVSQAGRRSVVRVLVDRDGGIDLDQVAEASRVVGDALDALDEAEPGLLGPSYVLEVSSPGVDRPLTETRHFRRNVGRLVTVTCRSGQPVTGRVVAAAEDALTLDVSGEQQALVWAEVVRGQVQVEFTRKDAPEDVVDEDEEST